MDVGIKKSILIFFYLISLTSCYREETIVSSVCKNCTKPVVLCFISPSDTIRAFVTISHSFNERNNNNFDGSIFIIDSAGTSVQLSNTPDNPHWYIDIHHELKPKAGAFYTMKIIEENGSISSAKTKVPIIADKWKYCTFMGCQKQDDGTDICLEKCVWTKHSKPTNIIGTGIPGIDDHYNLYVTIDFDRKFTTIDSITYECILDVYDRYTLYTINEPFESYMKSYYLFNKIRDDLQTNGVTEMFNGIVPEYTNFDNCLGVFGAYLTDTISINNPDLSPY
jgi:hypothetical protein